MAAGTISLRRRCQMAGSQTYAAGWCLSGDADSHPPGAPIESGRAKPVLLRRRESSGSARRPGEDGLASGGGGEGRCGDTSPLERVALYEVSARESRFPFKFARKKISEVGVSEKPCTRHEVRE